MAVRKMVKHLGVRLSREQSARLRRATQLENRRRPTPVDESTLAREFIVAGVEQILAAEPTPAKEVA